MNIIDVEMRGRWYKAYSDGTQTIIIGPPEGMVDKLGLSEPFATTLHNVLYNRGILNYGILSKRPNEVIGALQESLLLDAQKLTQAFYEYENPGGAS